MTLMDEYTYAMRCVALALLIVCSCGGGGGNSPVPPPQEQSKLSAKQITQQAKPAIVRVLVYGEGGSQPERIGTGFILSAEGRVATNLHVIAEADSIRTDVRVVLLDGKELPVKTIIAADQSRDLVLLGIDGAGELPTLELGNSDLVAEGDPVVAIGHPLGREYTVSDGLISSKRTLKDPLGRTLQLLQFSAPISVGSSGGPLFNERGQVIGVSTLIMREGQNLNFAIPANYLVPMLSKNGATTIQSFARSVEEQLAAARKEAGASGKERIQRQIPQHDPQAYSSCSDDSLKLVARSIQEAISVGAPLYNQGNIEACYKIYKNTHTLIESNDGLCQPVREALGQGLLRAETKNSVKAKSWALRDSFDGMLALVYRRLQPTPARPIGSSAP